jgi:hypothetical protein
MRIFIATGRPALRPMPSGRQPRRLANGCFYWTGSDSGAANGTGCLVPRVKSGEILP